MFVLFTEQQQTDRQLRVKQSLTERQTDRLNRQFQSAGTDRQQRDSQRRTDVRQRETPPYLLSAPLPPLLLLHAAGRTAGWERFSSSPALSQRIVWCVTGGEEGEAETQQTAEEEEEESSEDSEGANAANCPAEDERERGGRACIT